MDNLKILTQLAKKDKDESTYRGVVVLVDDVQLVHFLSTKYPDVLQEFYEEVHRNEDTPNSQVHNEGLSSNDS